MATIRTLACPLLLAALVLSAFAARAGELREVGSFGSNPGNLKMFGYVPDGLAPNAPLVVVLHGCKQEAASFARDSGFVARADRDKFALLLPQQRGLPPVYYDIFVLPWVYLWYGANNQNACFNWFERRDVRREGGEAQSIAQMIDSMIARHDLDRSRVFVVGLSAGGAMSAAMLAAYPEKFSGGAIVAGIPVGCADTVSDALHCMNPGVDRPPAEWGKAVPSAPARLARIAIWHGDRDERVTPLNARELVEQWGAVLGVQPPPARTQTDNLVRERYANADGSRMLESVTVKGLAHAFPVAAGAGAPCGQPGDFVAAAGVCAAGEIVKFWGIGGAD